MDIYSPFHMALEMWSVFFLLGLTKPRYFSSASARWNRALERFSKNKQYTHASITHIVFDSVSSSPSPTIALKADHRSVTLMRAPDSRYI